MLEKEWTHPLGQVDLNQKRGESHNIVTLSDLNCPPLGAEETVQLVSMKSVLQNPSKVINKQGPRQAAGIPAPGRQGLKLPCEPV